MFDIDGGFAEGDSVLFAKGNGFSANGENWKWKDVTESGGNHITLAKSAHLLSNLRYLQKLLKRNMLIIIQRKEIDLNKTETVSSRSYRVFRSWVW